MNLAVGFFDGVHAGHRRILARADAAFTFTNHPATVLAPDRAPPLLMTAEDRAAAIAAEGVDVRAVRFTRELAATPAERFAEGLRRMFPGLETVLCGPNWTFGAGGEGNADFLRARGFRAETVPFAEYGGAAVSSTRIRAALAAGDMAAANAMLGRPHSATGAVAPGKGVGRRIGFPTVNLRLPDGLVRLPFGVYAVDTPDGRGVANWGVAPTMGGKAWREPVLEAHLTDAPADYAPRSATMRVSFLGFIRPERRFATPGELSAQIARDVAAAARL